MQSSTSELSDADVTIVSVCYNSMAVLPAMLASVPEGVPVVLVDNAPPTTAELRDLAKKCEATLIENSDNQGFGVACNTGALAAETEYLLFLNPDAVLETDSLKKLVQAMHKYPDVSAVNPRIVSETGVTSFKRSSYLMPRSEKMTRGGPDGDAEITVMSGAAFFVRRSAFEKVGGFDPNIFLYHEDDDLSRRLKDQVGPLMFISDAVVMHQGGVSSERTAEIAGLKAWHMGRSRVYSTRKHGIPAPFMKGLHSALRQLFSVAVLFSKRKRAKQIAYLGGVLSTLKDGGKGKGERT